MTKVSLVACTAALCAAGALAAAQAPIHLPATPKTVTWGHYWVGDKPVLTVNPGAVVSVDTLITNSPQGLARAGVPASEIETSLKDVYTAFAHAPRTVKGPGGHILTGPIYIRGAEPGDTLAVHILKIAGRVPYAYNSFGPRSGYLVEPGLFKMRIIPLDWSTMTGQFAPGITLPLHPFFGSIGVAPPASYGRHSSVPPDLMGGNMDCKDLVAGTTIYFPVFTPGALFYVGDGHAGQGDGEVDITAIETSLEGTFRFDLIKHTGLSYPRAESPTNYISFGFNKFLTAATTEALDNMIDFLVKHKHMSKQDAYQLLSVAGNVHDCELVDQNMGVAVLLPKDIFTGASGN
ncbi:MAG: acetamidase/formamidase family protein [Terriglobales bacterium]